MRVSSRTARRGLIKQLDKGDDELDILYKASSPIKWLEYDQSMSLIKFTKKHMGSDKILLLESNVEENVFLQIGLEDYFKNLLTTTNCCDRALMVGVQTEMLQDTKVKGLPDSIDPSKPPRNYRHAMSLPDAQEWAEAYDMEYMGIKQCGIFETVLAQTRNTE
jgi:hypothetical protein